MQALPENQTLQFQLTIADTNTILAALGEQPAKLTWVVINKLHSQSAQQINAIPMTPPVTPEDKKPNEPAVAGSSAQRLNGAKPPSDEEEIPGISNLGKLL